MTKKLLVVVVALCALYFIGGFFAVKFEWLSEENYNSYATIFGGLASVFGLLSFTLPRLTTTDLREVEYESLQKVTKTVGELQQRANELSAKEQELARLNLQKAEMELLVRKASITLFLQDQLERSQDRIVSIVSSNSELQQLLSDVNPIKEKLTALQEQITKNEHVDLLLEIMESARVRDPYAGLSEGEKQLLAINKLVESAAKSVRKALRVSFLKF